MFKRLVLVCGGVLILGVTMLAVQPPPGFEPVAGLPADEQLPAAPLLITAYAFVWVAVLFYVWTIWRRLNRVETDMKALERRSRTR